MPSNADLINESAKEDSLNLSFNKRNRNFFFPNFYFQFSVEILVSWLRWLVDKHEQHCAVQRNIFFSSLNWIAEVESWFMPVKRLCFPIVISTFNYLNSTNDTRCLPLKLQTQNWKPTKSLSRQLFSFFHFLFRHRWLVAFPRCLS